MDNYEKLRQILHKHPAGAPKTKSFDEIMRLLFTPEEVEVDEDVCVVCGVCEDDRCPIGAVKVVEDVAQVDPDLCIGYGLCATTCEVEAVSMVPRKLAPEPPATVSEMGLMVATEKGRLDDSLKLVKR